MQRQNGEKCKVVLGSVRRAVLVEQGTPVGTKEEELK